MDLEHGLLLFFIGIPFSVFVLWGLINFINATEKQNKEDVLGSFNFNLLGNFNCINPIFNITLYLIICQLR